MKHQNIQIWFKSENFGPIISGEAIYNDNTDVIIEFDSGEKYVATFFTFKNIEHLRKNYLKSGECLNGKYFWASDLLLIDKITREDIEIVIDHLLTSGEFYSVFNKINDERYIWVFNNSKGKFSGGLFEQLELAENWISKNKLTGILTRYPVNTGVLDWSIENQQTGMTPEKLEEKSVDPDFVGSFTTAAQEHFHYNNGTKE